MVFCAQNHGNIAEMHTSNIQVHGIELKGGIVDIPILCMKCSDTPCKAACPPAVDAISVDEVTGAILLDKKKCIACNACVTACSKDRTGCLRISLDGMTVDGMCDLCGGNPACVRYCPENCLNLITFSFSKIPGEFFARKPQDIAADVWNVIYGL